LIFVVRTELTFFIFLIIINKSECKPFMDKIKSKRKDNMFLFNYNN